MLSFSDIELSAHVYANSSILSTLLRNLNAPSVPRSSHSSSVSGGAAKRINSLMVSAPYLAIISSGSTILPRDFDMTSPSFKTMPWVSNFWNGSEKSNRARSCRNFVKNLEYRRCNTACSMPPIYWSTGIQYLTYSLSKGPLSNLGEQNLRKYHAESMNVAIVSVSRRGLSPHLGHFTSMNSFTAASGLPPLPVNSTFFGRTTGRSFSGTGTMPHLSQ